MIHLVTGATGLIGSHVVDELVRNGMPVRALVRENSSITHLEQKGVDLVVGDLLDRGSVQHAMKGANVVIHCAGLVSDWGERQSFIDANVTGTRNVIDAAIDAGISRLVHLSSAAVYGYPKLGPDQTIDETVPYESRRIPYIESKIAAEKIVVEAVETAGLNAVMLRPAMVFGPRCMTYVGEIVHHLRQKSMLLLDGGKHVAGLAYVENVAEACLLAAKYEKKAGNRPQIFNVLDDIPVTWKEYIGSLAAGIGVRPPRFSVPTNLALPLATVMETFGTFIRRKNRPLLTRLAVLELGQPQHYDIGLARRELGFVPRVDFQTAIKKTLDWVEKHLEQPSH